MCLNYSLNKKSFIIILFNTIVGMSTVKKIKTCNSRFSAKAKKVLITTKEMQWTLFTELVGLQIVRLVDPHADKCFGPYARYIL